MHIFMYSDQVIEENLQMDLKLIEVATSKVGSVGKIKVGYIPSAGDRERKYYNDKVNYYQKYGISHFMFFDLDEEYDEGFLNDLMDCTIIHLSGGKPVELNRHVMNRSFGANLEAYLLDGGIVVGVSAGAIQLTRSIGLYLAYMFGFDYEREQHQAALTTSQLVDFEFVPHLNRFSQAYIDGLQNYSDRYGTRIYGCYDGGGIHVHDQQIDRFGQVIMIEPKNE